MALLRYILICLLLGFLTGCHFSYYVKGGYHQAKMLARQQNIEGLLQNPETKPEVKKKLELTLDVLRFMESELGLQTKGNYRKFVQLDDRFVTYAVTAAEKFKLKPYLWSFPIVGRVPYKGFFDKDDAHLEARMLKEKGYDTLVRGVSAYSSLGMLKDPILSSMINYRDEDYVNLLIHETVHANLYIKSAADFNEQLATFLGNKGTEAYYKARPHLENQAMDYLKKSQSDEAIFSEFMSHELKNLEEFYKGQITDEGKTERLKELQEKFKRNVLPRLQTNHYTRFQEEELNNAILISYRTYLMDLSDFEKIYEKLSRDFKTFFEYCKKLEKSKDPQTEFRSNQKST